MRQNATAWLTGISNKQIPNKRRIGKRYSFGTRTACSAAPMINVAMVDLAFVAERDTTVAEVNAVMREASGQAPLLGILGYSVAPLVSSDFNHNPASATFDATLTKVAGGLPIGCWIRLWL